MDQNSFSKRYRFSDFPNSVIPAVSAGVYAIWQDQELIYCGMSGRGMNDNVRLQKKKYGLITRLASHASGRLSGDLFCVFVANYFVVPSLLVDELPHFANGKINLDSKTQKYIHQHLEYYFALVEIASEAYELEKLGRNGVLFGPKPFLNPL